MTRLTRFEDYRAGQSGVTPAVTVSEAHIVAFASITGDYSFGHMDRHAMDRSPYGSRVAHGLLGSGLAVGMLSHWAPQIVGRASVGGHTSGFECNYRQPLKLGDTIRIDWRVTETNDAPGLERHGLVKSRFDVIDQGGEAVYDGTVTVLVGRGEDVRPEPSPRSRWSVVATEPDPHRIYHVEDLVVGHGGETEGRTVTEADIVNYAGLVGELDPRYVDVEAARHGCFGGRIAPPMLVFSVAFGLWHRIWSRYRSPDLGVGGHLNDSVTFCAPVRIGDTIRGRYQVLSTRLSRSKPGVGLETWGIQVMNQHDAVVQEGSMLMMRPSAAGSPQ